MNELLGPLNENLVPYPKTARPNIKNFVLLNYSLVKCIYMTFYKPASSLNSLDLFSLFFFNTVLHPEQ